MTDPRPTLIEMAMGFFRGKVLCASVRLGIADALGEGEGSLAELAESTRSDPAALRRFLRALAALGVVEELVPGRYRLTALGKPLRRAAPDSVWASTIFWSDLLSDAWTYLPECVRAGDRTGAEAARQRDGAPSRCSKEPEAQAIFHAVFAEPGAADFEVYAGIGDFSGPRVVADLGGGGGGLLAAVLTAHRAARGILVERPGALGAAEESFRAAGLGSRVELVALDLLESAPPRADVYLMRCVLHGYEDEAAARILRNVRGAMGEANRLLVLEIVLPDRIDRADPELERLLMSDLNMLAVTGGRERSEAEWRSLFGASGLVVQRIRTVAGPTPGILEAVAGD